MSDQPAPGWYPDPEDTTQLRWWDGWRWTEPRAPRAPEPRPGLRPVGDFLSAAFRALVTAWRPLLVLVAVGALPLIVAVVLADSQLGLSEWLDEVLEVVERAEPGEAIALPRWDVNPASVTVWALAIGLLYLVGFVVLPLAAVPVVDGAMRGTPVELDGAMRAGVRALPRAIGLGLLVTAAVIGILVVATLVTVAVPPLGLLLFLGLLPLLIWLGIRLGVVYQPLLVLEGRGLDLFRRSWELTGGHFWGLFGRSLLFGLIVGVASNLLTFPFQFLGSVDPALATMISLAVGLGAGAATGIVGVAGPLVLYRDLVDGPPPPAPPPVWGPPPTG